MRTPALIAAAALAMGAGHLFIVMRALLDPEWLHAIVIQAHVDIGDPIADWEEALISVLGIFSLVGILAVSCGVGLLRRHNLARRTWIAVSAVLVIVYGIAFVIYALSGVAWCASLAGIVTAVALASLISLSRGPVQKTFSHG